MMKNRALLGAMVVAVLLGAAAYATADVVTFTGIGTPRATAGTVTVNATVNPKLTLTIDAPDASQSVNFGTVDPGATASKTVSLSVTSNKKYDVGSTVSGAGVAPMGLTTSLKASTGNLKTTAQAFSDIYSINVPLDADPGVYAASVVYTVTQQ